MFLQILFPSHPLVLPFFLQLPPLQVEPGVTQQPTFLTVQAFIFTWKRFRHIFPWTTRVQLRIRTLLFAALSICEQKQSYGWLKYREIDHSTWSVRGTRNTTGGQRFVLVSHLGRLLHPPRVCSVRPCQPVLTAVLPPPAYAGSCWTGSPLFPFIPSSRSSSLYYYSFPFALPFICFPFGYPWELLRRRSRYEHRRRRYS